MYDSIPLQNNLLFKNVMVISNRALCQRPFLQQIERVCQQHPSSLILREKDLDENEYERLAQEVLNICNKYNVPCILHYFFETAIKLQVDKIHLPLWKLREVSPTKLNYFSEIGVSTHSIEEAIEASTLGATYITAGHLFTTDCKKGLPPRGLDFLESVCRSISVPVYGIGGIHLEAQQIQSVLDKGAQKVCIMSEMMKL